MIRDISHQITGHHYRDIHHVFDALPLSLTKSAIEKECSNLEKLIEKQLTGNFTQPKTEMLIVAGIPFSGKTTHIEKLPQKHTHITVAFDAIMQEIDVYQRLIAEKSNELAFSASELIARIAGYELLSRAIELKLPILFEHSSALQQHVDLYKLVKDNHGYQVDMHVLTATPSEAQNRALKLNQKRDNGRHTPDEYIHQRHSTLQKLLPEYEAIISVKYIHASSPHQN